MMTQDLRLIIQGIVSGTVIMELKRSFLQKENNPNTIVLFCGFSEYDIPLGSVFTQIWFQREVLYMGKAVLTKITQQFDRPIDEIPRGWRTVCSFTFEEPVPDVLYKYLPVVQSWSEGLSEGVLIIGGK